MRTRTSWRSGNRAIPASVPIAYDALKTAAVKGKTVGEQVPCPRCAAVGSLVWTGRWVARGSRWPGREGIEDRQTPVPEGRCTVCKRGCRILPVEIAPYKSYTRPVIETACAAYVAADRPAATLRQTVQLMGAHPPHPSSLHGWLDGLGARALGRLDRHGQGPPVAALLAETAKGLRPQLLSAWTTRPQPVTPHQYRSVPRRERLEACARLFDMARRLFPRVAYPWAAWEPWLETRFHVTAWGFPARLGCTAIQQHGTRKVAVRCAPSRPQPSRRKDGKAHGARSPP